MSDRALDAPLEIKASDLADSFGVRRFHALLLLASTMFVTVQGSVAGCTPYVMDSIKREYGISDAEVSLSVSAIILGSIPGVFIGGRLSDLHGRVRTLILCMVSTLILSLIHFVIPSGVPMGFPLLIAVRTLLGVPYGAQMSVQIPLLQEYFVDDLRGTAAAITPLGWNVGVLYVLTFMPVGDVGEFGRVNSDWRVCFGLGPVVPVVLSLCMLWFIPESPRWLFTQGQTKLAQQSLNVIFTSQPIYGAAFVGQAPIVDATELTGSTAQSILGDSTLRMVKCLFSPSLFWTTVVSTLVYFLLAGPSNTLWTWGPLLLKTMTGSRPPKETFKLVETYGLLGTLTTIAVIDRVSRRALVSLAFGMSVLSIFALFLGEHFQSDSVVIAWILQSYFQAILWCVVAVYISEAFPTVVRGTASGLVMLCGRAGSVFLPIIAGIWIRRSANVVLIATCIMFSVAALLALGIPRETSSLPMDDILSEEVAARTTFVRSADKSKDYESVA